MFNAIIGHDRPISILKRTVANKMLAHAYLFSGETGIGKKMTALALAAAVNCANPQGENGCGECPSCRMIAAGGHPDVHTLGPDGAEIKIDQIRQVQAELSLRPFQGEKKILIVDDADCMNTASANAFLKTLEEPPGDACIILVSAMPQSLLPTIRSRCQEVTFLPLPRHVLAKALVSRGLSEEDGRFLAALSQGSMGRALEMNAAEEKTARLELATLCSGLETMSPGDILVQSEALSRDRDRLERFLDIGVERLRDAMVFQKTGDQQLLVNPDGADAYRQWTEHIPLGRMLAEIDLFTESRRLLDRRVSAQLVTENLLLKLGRG